MPEPKAFALIKTLTRGETRTVSLAYGPKNGKAMGEQLFNVLRKMEFYDQATVLNRLGSISQSRLAKELNNLYDRILLELAGRDQQMIPSVRFGRLLKEVKFLIGRGLLDLAVSRLTKARQIAENAELFNEMLQLIVEERSVYHKTHRQGKVKSALSLREEERRVLRSIEIANSYASVYDQLQELMVERGRIRDATQVKELDAIMDNALLDSGSHEDSIRATYFYFKVHQRYHDLLGNWEEVKGYTQQILALYEANESFMLESLGTYVETYYRYLNSLLLLDPNGDEFTATLSAYRAIGTSKLFEQAYNRDLQSKYFTIYYHLELNRALTIKAYKDAFELRAEIWSHFEANQQWITLDERVVAHINMSVISYYNGYLKGALADVNFVLDVDERRVRKDILSFAKIFAMILHFDLGNTSYFEYLSRSTYRFMNKRDMFFNLEQVLYRFLMHVYKNVNNDKERREALEDLRSKLIALRENPRNRVVFDSFDFTGWVERQL